MASVLTKEQWAELRKKSIAGVNDTTLAHEFGIRTGTIRQRRYDDTEWLNARKEAQLALSQAKDHARAPAPLVENASLEEISSEHPQLLANFTHSKIKEAVQTNAIPAPTSWAELKTASEILRKAVGLDKDQGPVHINLWGAETDGVALYRDSGPVIETDTGEFV